MSYIINKDDCIYCGKCANQCPIGAIHDAETNYTIDSDFCVGCGTCAPVCPAGAIVAE